MRGARGGVGKGVRRGEGGEVEGCEEELVRGVGAEDEGGLVCFGVVGAGDCGRGF